MTDTPRSLAPCSPGTKTLITRADRGPGAGADASLPDRIKVFILDSDIPNLTCRTGPLHTDNAPAGVTTAQWLLAHPPASKSASSTSRPGSSRRTAPGSKGCADTVQATGFQVVAVATSDGSIEKTTTAADQYAHRARNSARSSRPPTSLVTMWPRRYRTRIAPTSSR
jgi:hypothetical protein